MADQMCGTGLQVRSADRKHSLAKIEKKVRRVTVVRNTLTNHRRLAAADPRHF